MEYRVIPSAVLRLEVPEGRTPGRRSRCPRWIAGVLGGLMVLATFPVGAQTPSLKDEAERVPAQFLHHGANSRLIELRAKPTVENTFVPATKPNPKGTHLTKSATFSVTYNDDFSEAAEVAFQHAVNIWSAALTSGVTIRVSANWVPLGPGVLGSAGSNKLWTGPGGAIFPDALADALNGADLGGGGPDIVANFNSDFGSWYLGIDGNTPPGMYDLVSVVLHEIGHGLGFFGSATVDDGIFIEEVNPVECDGVAGHGCWLLDVPPKVPTIFDLFTDDNLGNEIFNDGNYPDNSAELGGVLTGGGVFFDGANANAGAGGSPPELYAPGAWNPGSSYSHLDEAVYPAGNINSLMTPFLGSAEAIHTMGPITAGIFLDMGWTIEITIVFSDGFESGNTSGWTVTVGGI